jgi:hypothetical protein
VLSSAPATLKVLAVPTLIDPEFDRDPTAANILPPRTAKLPVLLLNVSMEVKVEPVPSRITFALFVEIDVDPSARTEFAPATHEPPDSVAPTTLLNVDGLGTLRIPRFCASKVPVFVIAEPST